MRRAWPPIEHGDRVTRGIELRGDLETAQMRCQEEDPVPRSPRLLDQFPARNPDLVDDFGMTAQPHPGQLQRLLARAADRRSQQASRHRTGEGL